MHKELIKEIVNSNNHEMIETLGEEFCKILDTLKERHPEKYSYYEGELYTLVNGEHLNSTLATKWVECMQNKDGTSGGHWTFADTEKVASQLGIDFAQSDFNKYEFYAIMNMVYSDFYGSIPNDTFVYGKMAKDWLDDKDAPDDKAFLYYWNVIKA